MFVSACKLSAGLGHPSVLLSGAFHIQQIPGNKNLTLHQAQVHACLPVQWARQRSWCSALAISGRTGNFWGWHFTHTNEPEIKLPPKQGGHFPPHPSALTQPVNIPALWPTGANPAHKISTWGDGKRRGEGLTIFPASLVSWINLPRNQTWGQEKQTARQEHRFPPSSASAAHTPSWVPSKATSHLRY